MTSSPKAKPPASQPTVSTPGTTPKANLKYTSIRPVGHAERALMRVERAHQELEYAIDQLRTALGESGGA